MRLIFQLNDRAASKPKGWDSMEISLKRDDKFHGMQIEASTGPLEFYGDDAVYLKYQKDTFGLSANVILKVSVACDEGETPEEIYRGRLNFGKYKGTCGTSCRVIIPAEEESCQITFKGRLDQKVDMDSLVAFDKTTFLSNYAQMGKTLDVPAKALQTAVKGHVVDGSNPVNDTIVIATPTFWIARPTYGVAEFNSIDTGQLEPVNDHEFSTDPFAIPITPQLLFEDVITCFSGDFNYEFVFVGTINITRTSGNVGQLLGAKLKLVKWDGIGTIYVNSTLVQEIDLGITGNPGAPIIEPFNETLTGTTPIADGEGFYGFVELNLSLLGVGTVTYDLNVTFAPATSVNIYANKLCPPTPVKYYMIHETLSRVAEAITNRCVRVKSAYYGRIDSQPFAFPADGCAGLRMLTSGLKLRQAPEDKYFQSMQDLLNDLYGIDNIGFSIDPDPDNPGGALLIVEPVEYFYSDFEIMTMPYVPDSSEDVVEGWHYSRILSGYTNWQVEKVNGLQEINATREHRTGIDTISNTLDITSKIVTGSYPIEITRQQSFADSGAADTKYDDMTFLICLVRNAYDFTVEQNNITGAANIYDPATLMNFRISPLRNLMRWYKSIVNSYPPAGSTSQKVFFSQGSANFTAAGELVDGGPDPSCKLENGVKSENQDIYRTDFTDQTQALPLWKNETLTHEYPLSVKEYLHIKANPYGYISVQCGTGGYQKAFIQEIKFSLNRGIATFTLRKKW